MKTLKSKTPLETQRAAAGHISQSKRQANPITAGVVVQGCLTCSDIDAGSRQTAQAKRLDSMFSSPLQRQPEEELAQGKFPVQRQEDEELMQGKFPVQRQPEEELQGKFVHQQESGGSSGPAAGAGMDHASGSDTGIPASVQTKMESAFNTGLSDVEVHANSGKATEVGALAFTQGKDIHFAPGQYNPDTSAGKKLLGHELTHVVQQAEGRVQPTGEVAGLPLNDNPALESEADSMGSKAV